MKYIPHMLIAGLVAVAVPTAIFGAELKISDQPNVAQNERIRDDVYMMGGAIRSAGVIEGDLIATGGSIVISGAVSGDLMAAGGTIAILGAVGDDLRVGGGNVVVNTTIGGDVLIGGGQVQLSGNGVNGDLLIGGGMVRIDAPIKGDVRIGGGDVVINAPVTGSVRFEGEKLTLGSATVIQGDLTYASAQEAMLESGAVVQGKTTYNPRTTSRVRAGGIAALVTMAFLVKFAAMLLAALVIGLMLRRYAHELVVHATTRPLLEIGRGFLAIIALPIASIIFLVTLIGIPFGILGILAFITLILFATLTAPIVLGSVVTKWIKKTAHYQVSWQNILLGVVLYTVIGLIPLVGWAVLCVLVLLTLGAMIRIKITALRAWR